MLRFTFATLAAFVATIVLAIIWTEFLSNHQPGEDGFGYAGVFMFRFAKYYLVAAFAMTTLYNQCVWVQRSFQVLNRWMQWLLPLFLLVYGLSFMLSIPQIVVHLYWLILKIASATSVIEMVYQVASKPLRSDVGNRIFNG